MIKQPHTAESNKLPNVVQEKIEELEWNWNYHWNWAGQKECKMYQINPTDTVLSGINIRWHDRIMG